MYKKIFKWVFWATTVALMICIFLLSHQVANKSQKTSESFTRTILSVSKSFNELPEIKQTQIIENVQFSVRKAAHFSIYVALGISLLSAMFLTFKKRFLWLYSFIVCVLYAVSDEIHQLFVVGRSCKIGDVFIDSMGALSGILIVLIITSLYKIKKTKKAKR
ncbi:MAG: VanZ family protein [Clostridiales bacterium]|nr:VanZ family protein [Clostridiales bacterium]